jgi:hypothetical protein
LTLSIYCLHDFCCFPHPANRSTPEQPAD